PLQSFSSPNDNPVTSTREVGETSDCEDDCSWGMIRRMSLADMLCTIILGVIGLLVISILAIHCVDLNQARRGLHQTEADVLAAVRAREWAAALQCSTKANNAYALVARTTIPEMQSARTITPLVLERISLATNRAAGIAKKGFRENSRALFT